MANAAKSVKRRIGYPSGDWVGHLERALSAFVPKYAQRRRAFALAGSFVSSLDVRTGSLSPELDQAAFDAGDRSLEDKRGLVKRHPGAPVASGHRHPALTPAHLSGAPFHSLGMRALRHAVARQVMKRRGG